MKKYVLCTALVAIDKLNIMQSVISKQMSIFDGAYSGGYSSSFRKIVMVFDDFDSGYKELLKRRTYGYIVSSYPQKILNVRLVWLEEWQYNDVGMWQLTGHAWRAGECNNIID